MSDLFNISGIVKGEPFTSTITASLCTTGQFNLSGYSIVGGIRYQYSSGNIADFDIEVNSTQSGIFTINLTSGQTNNLPVSQCIYYIKAWPSGQGSIVDLLNGYALINPL